MKCEDALFPSSIACTAAPRNRPLKRYLQQPGRIWNSYFRRIKTIILRRSQGGERNGSLVPKSRRALDWRPAFNCIWPGRVQWQCLLRSHSKWQLTGTAGDGRQDSKAVTTAECRPMSGRSAETYGG